MEFISSTNDLPNLVERLTDAIGRFLLRFFLIVSSSQAKITIFLTYHVTEPLTSSSACALNTKTTKITFKPIKLIMKVVMQVLALNYSKS
jgi:hypothetical protein